MWKATLLKMVECFAVTEPAAYWYYLAARSEVPA